MRTKTMPISILKEVHQEAAIKNPEYSVDLYEASSSSESPNNSTLGNNLTFYDEPSAIDSER